MKLFIQSIILISTAYKNKRVLIIGSGNSGCDIAVDLCRYADKVVHSCRRAYHYMPKFIHGKPTQEWLIDVPLGIFQISIIGNM